MGRAGLIAANDLWGHIGEVLGVVSLPIATFCMFSPELKGSRIGVAGEICDGTVFGHGWTFWREFLSAKFYRNMPNIRSQ